MSSDRPRISIVIVNYNVEYFLEQCLYSVFRALEIVEGEVYVVDNNSIDGSVEMVKRRFPSVHLIANKENLGFSRANNQAIERVQGDYVLLLNPDTVVEEDTFRKVVDFMDENPDAGGLGVKMLDGRGEFLPESKRGLPTPSVAFYKIFGLSKLFPRSKKFGRYHLGYLDEDEVHEIEVLSGAFMLMRKKALDEVGLLDPTFFMYGEDIDLSYRLTLGGYKNYYYPETRIIHYKGESTKKSSINYVFNFYKAMLIFANKHFTRRNALFFSKFIQWAIYFRAGVAIFNRFMQQAVLPIADATLVGTGILGFEYLIKESMDFPGVFAGESLVITLFILVWMIGILLSGGYDKPIKTLKIVKGWGISTMLLAVLFIGRDAFYGVRFGEFLVYAFWGFLVVSILRQVFHYFRVLGYDVSGKLNRRFLIIGGEEESERISVLLKQTNLHTEFLGVVSPDVEQKEDPEEGIIGNITELSALVKKYNVDEVIFSAWDINASVIVNKMVELKGKGVDNKIAPPDSLYIIGSNSVENSGELYMLDINSVGKPENRRNKRILDIVVCFLLILGLPVLLFFIPSVKKFISNLGDVLMGERTWVGYYGEKEKELYELPKLKPCVLAPLPVELQLNDTNSIGRRLNLIYAKDYHVYHDLNIIFSNIRQLGT